MTIGGPTPKYFFLNGHLHRRIWVSIPEDKMKAFDFDEEEYYVYSYADARDRMQYAYSTVEVGKLINRTRRSVFYAVHGEHVRPPKYSYSIDEKYANSPRRVGAYWWDEDRIFELHDYFVNLSRGKPRRDGKIVTAANLPSRRQLRSAMNKEESVYIKDEDGNFVPTWKRG